MYRFDRNFFLFITFIILGMMLAVQARSTFLEKKKRTPVELEIAQYTAQLEERRKEVEQLTKEISEYQARYNEEINKLIEESDDEELKREWEEVRLKAGLKDVKGPGVVVTLDDAPARTDENPNLLIIHDQDIKIIVNELKKAGAQAISINGERITPISEMICGGPTILINRNRYVVPYVIHAIGDPDLLYDAVFYNERVALIKEYNVRVDVKKQNEVLVPGFKPELSNKEGLKNFISSLEVANGEMG